LFVPIIAYDIDRQVDRGNEDRLISLGEIARRARFLLAGRLRPTRDRIRRALRLGLNQEFRPVGALVFRWMATQGSASLRPGLSNFAPFGADAPFEPQG